MTLPESQAEGQEAMSEESFALEHTPTWAVAAVCIVFIALSLLMQRGLQRLGTWLLSSHKKPLYEALEKMKEELMLLGFISLLLTAAQNPMSRLCMPAPWANEMLPCHFQTVNNSPRGDSPLAAGATIHNLIHRSTFLSWGPVEQVVRRRETLSLHQNHVHNPHRMLSGTTTRKLCSKGHVPLMSTESLHQLHIFIFVMAVVHVFYSCFTMLFGFTQLRNWRKWEEETNVDNYNYTDEIKKSFNEEAFPKIPFRKMGFGSLRRQSTFVTSRTMTPWATTTYGIWFNSFFRQFHKSVTKSDYLTLRLGFIKNHNAPMHLNFHKYIMNSLEDDLKTVIGISGYLWVFVIFFMILNVHGWYAYFWMSFIPVLINLVIGAKLQHIITQLAMETAHAHGIVAVPIKPRDELFWFNNPHLLLYLIHFVLFQNAFELAFCIWLVTTFGFNSCFFAKHGFIISRVIVGILAQVLCSYSTLPLYALVSQMGSHYKKAIFADPVSTAVTDWRNKAKANIQQTRQIHKKDLEHAIEVEGSSQSNSLYMSHDLDHDHGHIHHHHYSSILLVTADGEIKSQAHDNNFLTHPPRITRPQIDEMKSDLISSKPKEYCGECERLSLTLDMDVGDLEGNMELVERNQGSTCPLEPQHLLSKRQKKAGYVRISCEDTNNGFPFWSLECIECKSFKALTIESSLFKNEDIVKFRGETLGEGNTPKSPRLDSVHVLGRRKTIFLRMSRASEDFKGGTQDFVGTPQKPNGTRGPTLDQMRRLPSREMREMRNAEGTHTLEPYRPDLDIPELMMCTNMLNDPKKAIEVAKSTSFSSRSTIVAGSSSSHCPCGDIPIENQALELEKLTSFRRRILDDNSSIAFTHGHFLSEDRQLKKSTIFISGMATTNLPSGESNVPNDVIEEKKAPTLSNI